MTARGYNDAYTQKLLAAVPGLESAKEGGVRLFWRRTENDASIVS